MQSQRLIPTQYQNHRTRRQTITATNMEIMENTVNSRSQVHQGLKQTMLMPTTTSLNQIKMSADILPPRTQARLKQPDTIGTETIETLAQV